MVYPALLPLMRTPRLPVFDWTDAPRRFKWTRPFRRKTKPGFCACAITFQLAYISLPRMGKTCKNLRMATTCKGLPRVGRTCRSLPLMANACNKTLEFAGPPHFSLRSTDSFIRSLLARYIRQLMCSECCSFALLHTKCVVIPLEALLPLLVMVFSFKLMDIYGLVAPAFNFPCFM